MQLPAIFKTPKLHLKKLDVHLLDYKHMDVFTTSAVDFCGELPPENAFTSLVM